MASQNRSTNNYQNNHNFVIDCVFLLKYWNVSFSYSTTEYSLVLLSFMANQVVHMIHNLACIVD